MTQPLPLPHGVTLLERGWLSSNNILIKNADHCALVDSGYATHTGQTLAKGLQADGPLRFADIEYIGVSRDAAFKGAVAVTKGKVLLSHQLGCSLRA